MSILCVLLSMMMTWTVENKSTVRCSGDCLEFVQADYHCTYQKGTVRAGDEAVLTLSALPSVRVERVELSMRANQKSGAGTVRVEADGQEIASQEVSYEEVSSAVTVYDSVCESVHQLTVSVIGTQNSLYVESFSITYSLPSPHTVSMMLGDTLYGTLTERESGAGVSLPILNDRGDWRFVGWAETPFWTVYERPTIYPAQQTLYPLEDVTVWAVYRYHPEKVEEYMTDCQSGDYLYVNRHTGMALSGVPEEGGMESAPADVYDPNQVYHVEWVDSDTVYITHALSNVPIGYKGLQLASIASPWLVYHEGEETYFYTEYNQQTYVLWLNVQDTHDQGLFYVGLIKGTVQGGTPMTLMIPQDEPIEAYTCHPETGMGMESVGVSDEKAYVIPFGVYRLHIVNGKKYLYIE